MTFCAGVCFPAVETHRAGVEKVPSEQGDGHVLRQSSLHHRARSNELVWQGPMDRVIRDV